MLTLENNIREAIKNTGSKIFSVQFVKKDGTIRDMVCRTGVKKDLKGIGLNYDPISKGLLCVFDMQKNGYRMINVNTITKIKIEGTEWNF